MVTSTVIDLGRHSGGFMKYIAGIIVFTSALWLLPRTASGQMT